MCVTGGERIATTMMTTHVFVTLLGFRVLAVRRGLFVAIPNDEVRIHLGPACNANREESLRGLRVSSVKK